MASRYHPDDGIPSSAEKSSVPETLYVDLQGDQRTRPIMCATEFSGTGGHKKKSTSFQITSVTVQGSRLSNDGGDDSADDLDESHTEDISSDILDCSKTTDLDNDPLSSDNSNANLEDLGISIASKQFIPVKVLTNDPDAFGASHSVNAAPGLPITSTVLDSDVTLMTNTPAALPVITTQVPMVNTLPEHLPHRFKVVKIVSKEPFKRGRWSCMDFTDPPAIHSEQKMEPSEVIDTTHATGTYHTAPGEIQPSVTQFYEFPLNQTGISNLAPHQQVPQSVYGILLPVANNPGPPVTKVQNVGVQATPTLPADPVGNQTSTLPTQPVGTQSQSTQVPAPSLAQIPQVSTAQSQTILPTSQSQGVYPVTNQVSQPNQGLPITQPAQVLPATQPQQAISVPQPMQALPQQAATVPMSQPNQAIPIIQPTQNQVIPQPSTLPASHVQPGMQTNQVLAPSLSIPPTHIITTTQAAQGIPIAQPTQGLPITQANPGLSMAVSGAALPNVQPIIPVSQPSQVVPINQPVQGIPITSQAPTLPVLQDLPTSQPPQTIGITANQQTGGIGQTNQGLPSMQPGPVLSMTQPSSHPPVGLPLTQATSTLQAPQPSVQPVLDSSVGAALQESLVQSSNAKDTQPLAAISSNHSPLLDILPDTLGTKALQDGEESESASSGTNTVAIDNKIEQAMDLVKSHLMFAVREEVDVLKEKITELMDRISQLEHENGILKANATPEMLNQLEQPPSNPPQPPANHEHP